MIVMRIAKLSLLLFLLALVSFTVPPVSADIMTPTTTHVFFEKDGAPYNRTVQFTVNCNGHFDYPWIPRTTVAQPEKTAEKEVVFSYSATCPEYGCLIYESYYLNYRAIDSCDLEGTAGGIHFIVHDFTRNPQPKNCTGLHQFDVGKGNDGYFRITPEYKQCQNASYEAKELCDSYTIPCGPVVDIQCGNRIVAGRLVNDTEKARTCREEADTKRRACDVYLEKLDPSAMVMWKNNLTGQYEPAMRSCEKRLTIPPDNMTSSAASPSASAIKAVTTGPDQPMQEITYGTRAVATARSLNPVESLWCSILRLFGGKCA
jgi:hypothetical protein